MAKYTPPFNKNRLLRDTYGLLKQEREICEGREAMLVGGKYDGYRARCINVIVEETSDQIQFMYWFNIYRQDGDGFLINAAASLTEKEIEWT